MAYSTDNPPRCIVPSVGKTGGALWYYADADAIATVRGADYFSNGDALGMEVEDVVLVVDEGASVTVNRVSAVTAGGAATVTA